MVENVSGLFTLRTFDDCTENARVFVVYMFELVVSFVIRVRVDRHVKKSFSLPLTHFLCCPDMTCVSKGDD